MPNTEQAIEVGSTVVFQGFTGEDVPDNAEVLVQGNEYSVVKVNEADDASEETSYVLEADNPDFNSEKRASKKNPRTITVDVFFDEIAVEDMTDSGAEEEQVEMELGVEGMGDSLEYADMHKGNQVSAYDEDEKLLASGTITRKTKRGITIVNDDAEEVVVDPNSATFYEGLYEEESEEMETVSPEEDPELKDMIILSEDEEDQDIVSLVTETEDICELAHEMSEESASMDYRLGGVLYHVRLSGAYKQLNDGYAGKRGFESYIDSELPVGYRKAMYLIDIYSKWNKFGLDPAKVQEIGWTKAQEISRVMTDENAEQLVAMAEENTVSDIKETIRESYTSAATTREQPAKRITFKFRLLEEAASTVAEYFEQAKLELGMERDEEVFEQIVTQWATEHLSVRKAKKKATSKKATSKKAVAKKATTKKAVAKKTTTRKAAAKRATVEA